LRSGASKAAPPNLLSAKNDVEEVETRCIVRRVVTYGLERRRRRPLHILGIDEVGRRKGHHYLTVACDLERRALLWVGENRTEETLTRFFTELGRCRSATVRVVCLDMWQAYLKAVQNHAPQARVLFERFHLVQHLNRAVDEVRRNEMRRVSGREKTAFKKTRFLLLKNPWNLRTEERERLSTLVRWNTPIVRAYYLKEAF
jgi:transposase